MKYVHPDILDNGLAYLRSNATRALLLPTYVPGMSYGQAVATAALSATISESSFALSNEGTGRKVVFGGAEALASANIAPNTGARHVAYTDGTNRVLWVDEETSKMPIITGQSYRLPVQLLIFAQPV